MEVSKEEKRRFVRVKFKTPLRFQIRGRSEFDNSLSKDISLGGISIISDNFVPPNANLMLEFNLLAHFMALIGKVVWSSPLRRSNRFRSGIEFLEMEPSEKKSLGDFITLQKQNP